PGRASRRRLGSGSRTRTPRPPSPTSPAPRPRPPGRSSAGPAPAWWQTRRRWGRRPPPAGRRHSPTPSAGTTRGRATPARACSRTRGTPRPGSSRCGRPAVLAGHPARLRPLLQEPRLVGDEHPARVTEVLGHVPEQVVADGVGVPVGPGQQVLHPVGGRVAQVLGQLPPVLPLDPAEQPADVPECPPPRLAPREPAPDPPSHRVQPARPVRHSLRRRPSCHRSPPPETRARAIVVTTAVGLAGKPTAALPAKPQAARSPHALMMSRTVIPLGIIGS